MDANSQKKVIDAGFRIIRAEDEPAIRIEIKDMNRHDWTTLKYFPSKAARDRYMKNLLEDNMIITD
jgi:hypothetical protein